MSTDTADNKQMNHATSDVPVLRRAAMDFLARREHSFQELQQKMQRKFPDNSEAEIRNLIDTLKAEGLQSDERFAESWVRYRQSRGFGYHHIRGDLRERGIASPIIDKYLFSDDDCWCETASSLVEKRLGPQQQVSFGSGIHRKLQRYLESRGFGSGEIHKALNSRLVNS